MMPIRITIMILRQEIIEKFDENENILKL